MTAAAILRYSFLVGLLLTASPLLAQTAPAAQPTTASASQSAAAEGTPVEAEVIEVKGRAQHAPVGTTVTDPAAWQAVQLNDRYSAGTLIRTGLGSHVILRFGQEEPYTVVLVERMTLANIAALYKTATEKVSQVQVNYGAVRGGVSEGGLRSSFVVDSTVATLTKRGTWGFRMFIERGTGRFTISLADAGMIEALSRLTHQGQTLYPGQYVNQAMIRWVDQTLFDRLIAMQDLFGLTSEEFQFQALHDTGVAILEPGPYPGSYDAARPGYTRYVSQRVLENEQGRTQYLVNFLNNLLNPPAPGTITRPEGNFNGTFR
jgi:hypothetical protein